MLAKGCTRTTLLIGKWALKFPCLRSSDGRWWVNFLYGLLGNMHEIDWNRAGNRKLCPILFHLPGGFLNVMPRVTPLERELTWGEYCEFIELSEDGAHLPVEYKPDSFGLLNGRVVAIDYGS